MAKHTGKHSAKRSKAAGVAAFLVLLVTGTTLPILTVATIGLGLCMSGMYGTTVANAGDLFSRNSA